MNDDERAASWLLYLVGKLNGDERAIQVFIRLMMCERTAERKRQADIVHCWVDDSGSIRYASDGMQRASRETAKSIEHGIRSDDNNDAQYALMQRIEAAQAVMAAPADSTGDAGDGSREGSDGR